MDTGTVDMLVGVALLLVGSSGATLTHRRQHGRPVLPSVIALAPFGLLIGAGAALVRGWDLGLSAVAGALAVLIVAVGGDVWAARRRARATWRRARRAGTDHDSP